MADTTNRQAANSQASSSAAGAGSTSAAFRLVAQQLTRAAVAEGMTEQTAASRLEAFLSQFVRGHGLDPAAVTEAELEDLLFPAMDNALRDILPETARRSALRAASEGMAAALLGAQPAPPIGHRSSGLSVYAASSQAFNDDEVFIDDEFELELDDIEDGDAEDDDQKGGMKPNAVAGAGDFDFDEDEFELDDPDYLSGPRTLAFDLADPAAQGKLIAHLGRVSGVRSVLICRRNGEVVQSRSLSDVTKLGSVVAATMLLLNGQSLRLLSVQLGGQTVCVRPLGEYGVAVLAGAGTNVGRLLTELGSLQAADPTGS